VGIGVCSVAFSGGIPTGTWGISAGTSSCSSCVALRLSLLRLHSPCVDLFNAFEFYLSICMNLQAQRIKIERTHRYFHRCNARSQGGELDVNRSMRKKMGSCAKIASSDQIESPSPRWYARTVLLFCMYVQRRCSAISTLATGFFLYEEDHVIT